jgi:hypothetical protein
LANTGSQYAGAEVNMTTDVVVVSGAAMATINYAQENDKDLFVMSSHVRFNLLLWT